MNAEAGSTTRAISLRWIIRTGTCADCLSDRMNTLVKRPEKGRFSQPNETQHECGPPLLGGGGLFFRRRKVLNEINVFYLEPRKAPKPDRKFPGWRQEIEISGLSLIEIVAICLGFISVVVLATVVMVVAR